MTEEEIKELAENFAKYCLTQADNYTSSGCEEISWVIDEINTKDLYNKFINESK